MHCLRRQTRVSKFLVGRPLRYGNLSSGLPRDRWNRPFSDGPIASALSQVPTVLVPPAILVGLTVALWTVKCINLVVFQNKIIYMPYMPPFARSDTIENYDSECGPVQWREERIDSLDGTRISIMVGEMTTVQQNDHQVLVLYFQDIAKATGCRTTIAALSYRGYWTSRGKPSQAGIELDARAFLNWAHAHQATHVVLWGQSLGAGVAVNALLSLRDEHRVSGVVLETPFVSLRRMLVALYPQKWLPYRRLWPFLRSNWDSEAALRELAGKRFVPPILLLPAVDDEVVPPEEVEHLQSICEELGLEYRRRNVRNAFHNDASSKDEGRRAIAGFVSSSLKDGTGS